MGGDKILAADPADVSCDINEKSELTVTARHTELRKIIIKTDVVFGEDIKILCDAFFVPGVVFLAIGALILVSNGGFFDGIAYGVKTAFCALVPGLKLKKGESYADFKARKQENRKPAAVKAPFITGCAFAAISIVFLVLYYSVA